MFFVLLLAAQLSTSPSCTDWHDCRDQALQAAARADYERFHDLSWSAVQKGPKDAADLLFMLARAQSLSGRPDDAVVMLERLARMGADVRSAETSSDFSRARGVPRWAEFESLLHAEAAAAPATPEPPVPAVAPARVERKAARPETREASKPAASRSERSRPAAPATREEPPAPPVADKTPAAMPSPVSESAPSAAAPSGEAALTFDTPAFDPVGLAYDAVSRRFVVGDRVGRRLLIVDEVSHHVVTLAAASSAGFGDQLTSFEIDPRRGDLWVVSATSPANHPPSSILHKLQLVSGRVLFSVAPPAGTGRVRFADVAVTSDGMVVVLDSAGGRIFRMRAGSRDLEPVAVPALHDVLSIAPADDRVAYVATADRIVRVNFERHTATAVRAERGTTGGFTRLRWYGGSLVGVDAHDRVVRLRLDAAGTAVVRTTVLAGGATAAGAVAGDSFYFLSSDAGVIRRVRLR
ncbi:MAG TPA: hypothetical protein VFX12_05750 [Vicinamibacterales bacterium]|nr:hypothetical protein [Vicinamibacterales bacterium]